ncbi:MAG: FtsX-like permease family protein, partial [Candidatus Acidiferrales bacterium]
ASGLREASRFIVEGQPLPDSGIRPVAQFRTASQEYFVTVGIRLLRGRWLNQSDWGQLHILANETMARRFWPDSDPIDKRINMCSLDPKPCWYQIVGVVSNVHQFGLDAGPTYDVYLTGGWTGNLVIRAASDPGALANAAAQEIHKIDPALPVTHVTTLDGLLADSVSPRRFSAVLIAVFAALALLLAAVGIYGVMSYTVGQRTQEIGIRMALGAQPDDVLKMILRRGMLLAFAGVVAGLAGSLALTRFLATLLFGVKADDPGTFAAVTALLVLVAMAACYLPARRAMRVDPMVALRYE